MYKVFYLAPIGIFGIVFRRLSLIVAIAQSYELALLQFIQYFIIEVGKIA